MASKIPFSALFNDITDWVRTKVPDPQLAQALCDDLNHSKTSILRSYDGIRDYVKTTYMRDPNGLLDRHKCAASFMAAMLNELKLGNCSKLKNTPALLREKITIAAGMSVLRTFIFGDNANGKNAGMIAFLTQHGGFKFPAIICDDNPYAENWAKELYYGFEEKRLLVLSLSNELFCIERYNMQLLEIKHLQQENESLAERIKNFSAA